LLPWDFLREALGHYTQSWGVRMTSTLQKKRPKNVPRLTRNRAVKGRELLKADYSEPHRSQNMLNLWI